MKDESEYVRRSVANNLNDISKDNPQTVLRWAEQWLGDNKETDRVIKHACRSLLKQGDTRALSLFGFTKANHITLKKFDVQSKVCLGEKLHFSFLLKSQSAHLGRCRIEFAIDFMKANGKQGRKVFKISEGEYPEQEKLVSRYFSFKEISTRKYYAGQHCLTIIVNGVDQSTKHFQLIF